MRVYLFSSERDLSAGASADPLWRRPDGLTLSFVSVESLLVVVAGGAAERDRPLGCQLGQLLGDEGLVRAVLRLASSRECVAGGLRGGLVLHLIVEITEHMIIIIARLLVFKANFSIIKHLWTLHCPRITVEFLRFLLVFLE